MKELLHMSGPELDASGLVGEVNPSLGENFTVSIKYLQGALLVKVELFELLNDNEDKQVEHDIRCKQYHREEVDRCKTAAACLTRDAIG